MAADTIYAPSTAPGRAAIAIVRISGPMAGSALLEVSGRSKLPDARRATLVTLSRNGVTLDRAMALWLPAPNSVTGEDLAELHLHGGPAVMRNVLSALGAIDGLRIADPGEFTRRGFLAGKLDLTQAEAIADLIDAETELQAAQALAQMSGDLGRRYESWRARIIRGLAYSEAVLDFPDEDVPDQAAMVIAPDLKSVSAEIAEHLTDGNRGEILREGLSVVILGPPNAGKSSLLNALARRDVAIVSELAGTTRDLLEVRLNVNGYPVILTDTAGLRETAERIESEGIRRALARAATAHVRLLLVDPDSSALFNRLAEHLMPGDLVVWSKSDLGWQPPNSGHESLGISVQSSLGLDALIAWIGTAAARATSGGESVPLTRARHRHALEGAKLALERGLSVLGHSLDLAAEDFRIAARSIGQITGRVDVEDMLDVVFRDFCIGK